MQITQDQLALLIQATVTPRDANPPDGATALLIKIARDTGKCDHAHQTWADYAACVLAHLKERGITPEGNDGSD